MRTQNLVVKNLPIDQGYLTLLSNNVRKTFELHEHTIIGRDENAQIILADSFLSLRHARIEKKEDGYLIRDLRSRNGTYVNGSRILEAKLQNHDRIQVGCSEFLFTAEKDLGFSPTFVTSLNPAWEQQLKRLPALAQSPHPILLLGPSGTGKEILAQMIHRFSFRANGPFVSVNCSALTESLAESELFGHVKGSFTGANDSRKGAFESARGGTLFLDEIGDMPLNIQPKFLRALENQEIKAVGSDSTSTIDVRIVAATNKNLKELVSKGNFREDLYFRLHILQIQPPPLKDRKEDFDMLLQSFARPAKVYFTREALAHLKEYEWPGNIRELKNIVSRASALFGSAPVQEKDLEQLIDKNNPMGIEQTTNQIYDGKPSNVRKYLRDYEREAIIERLLFYSGNQRRAATDLGIAKSTLHDRIRRYGINVKNIEAYKNEIKKENV